MRFPIWWLAKNLVIRMSLSYPPCFRRLVGTSVNVFRTRFAHLTKPPTSSLPLGTLADLAKSKAELIAENALLRQQRIILKRQVNRPACTKTDRILLVLLARAVRAWKQTLFIIQPDTLLRWHRELFRLYWKRRSNSCTTSQCNLRTLFEEYATRMP